MMMYQNTNQIYDVLSNIKDILLKEHSLVEIKNIDELKLNKFYTDINKK